MSTTITVTIDPQGAVTSQVHGVQGRSCRDASRFLHDALGTVTSDRPTAEMHQTSSERTHNHEQT